MKNLANMKLLPPNPLLPTSYSLLPTTDFWSRQANAQDFSFEFAPFGIPATITANQPEILAAARLSAGRFSLSQESTRKPSLQPPTFNLQPSPPIHIQLVVTDSASHPVGDSASHPVGDSASTLVGDSASPPLVGTGSVPVPANLPERLTYAGVGEWISLSAGEWGYAFAHLPMRAAVAFLSPALAAEIRLVSRYLIDHYLLNFILTEWAMLHASCVFDPRRQRLILMVAPHNTGKSTTALHLLRAGYLFLADGMALLRQRGDNFVVGGYPIGEVKLRDDVLFLFPHYTGEAVKVREQRKTVVNLRAVHPNQLVETLFVPSSIQLCFVERSGSEETWAAPLSPAEAAPLLAENTVYWAEQSHLAHNSATLHALLAQASLYRLKIGTDREGLVNILSAA